MRKGQKRGQMCLVFLSFFLFLFGLSRSQCPVSNQRNQFNRNSSGIRAEPESQSESIDIGGGCKRVRVRSLNEVIGVVRIGLKSLGFFLHAFLDFQDGRRLRLILQTKNKPEWLSTNALSLFLFGFQFQQLKIKTKLKKKMKKKKSLANFCIDFLFKQILSD